MIGKNTSGTRVGRVTVAYRVVAVALVLGMFAAMTQRAAADDKKAKLRRQMRLERDPSRPVTPKGLAGTGTTAPATKPVANVEGPHAVIEAVEPVFDFGTRWIGPALEHTFTIKNAGDKTLEISRVKPSCGCTVAGNYPRKIEAGQTGEFPFTIASTKLRGRFQKSITVTSNDPVTPELRLQLKGEVKRFVDVSPANANFGKIIGQEKQVRVLNITNNTEKPLQAVVAPTKDGQFDYELVETEPGKKYELRVTANPPFAPGALKSETVVKTNVDEQKEVQIVTRATVPARLDLQPSVISLRNNTGPAEDRGVSRVVRFTNYGTVPVKLLEANVDDPSITTTINERTPGKAYTVLVQFPPKYQVPAGGKALIIKTDDKEEPQLTVRIQGPAARTAERRRPAEELVGQSAPSFSTTTIEGKSVSNADFREGVTILDFFAVNCGFCKKQIPRLETVRQQYVGKPVRFITVAETMRQRPTLDDVKAKIDELGFKGEVALDLDNKIGPMFKATSFPTMVVIDKSGKIGAVNVGNVGDLESRLKTQLDSLLAGKPIPKTAAAKPEPTKPQKADANSLIGKPAPAFTASTIEGKPVGGAEFAKYPATVLDFFAPNCGFCKKQIPRLETVREKYLPKGVRFVNISQNMHKDYSQEEVVKVLEGLGFKGELVINHTNSIGSKFNARGFPTMVIVGKDGKVGAVNIGNLPDLEDRVSKQLDAAIAGKPFPQSTDAAKPASRRRPAEELVGKAAPEFSLQTVDGKSIGSDDFAKHPAVVLNFVAPNCGFCKRQLPNVEKIRAEYASKGVRFVNVAQTMRKEYTVEETIDVFKKVGTGFELAKDNGNVVGRLYKAVSFPTMIVVGKDGNIANVNVGAKPDIDTLLKGQLDALIKKAG